MMRGVFVFLFSVMLVRVGIAGSDGWPASSEMRHEDARGCISLPLPTNWHVATLSENEILLQPQEEEAGAFQSKVIRVTAFEAKNSVFETLIKSADKYMSLICPCTSTFLAYDVMMRADEEEQVKIMRFSCTNTESFIQSFVRHIPGKEIDFVVSYRLYSIFKPLPAHPLSYREWQGIITTLRAIHICESDTDIRFLREIRETRETYEWRILKSQAKVVETSQERKELRALVGD